MLCLTGALALAVAEPRRLRCELRHTPARVVHRARRHVVRILDGWPTAEELLGAYGRSALLA